MRRIEFSRKEKVRYFLKEVVHAGALGALDGICAPSYVPHAPNLQYAPTLAPGLEALRTRLYRSGPIPNRVFRIIADEDFVFAQVRYAGDIPMAGADIFHFDSDEKIAEHWSLRQAIQDEADSGYDRFRGGGDPDAPTSDEQRTLQKQRVRALYLNVWTKANSDLVTQYYADDYVQHNPHIPSGSARIKQIIETNISEFIAREKRNYPITIHHVGSEGDLVFAHCSIYMAGLTKNEGDRSATVDIFRIDCDGKMAEHWDVLQIETERSANDTTFF